MRTDAPALFKYQSGRVIALGRVILAALFLLSIRLDDSQPAHAPGQTYAILAFYVAFSIGLTALTWRNWWLDARLAAVAHVVDIAVFTAVIFSTNGYTSPFFLFFILPLLSAAIRWGWKETALTAVGLVLLYLTAGLLVAESKQFEIQRFVTRSGHLVILSALLIWFGMHQQFTRLFFSTDPRDHRSDRRHGPLTHALLVAMDAAGARSGALLLAGSDDGQLDGVRVSRDQLERLAVDAAPVRTRDGAMLFDLKRDRCVSGKENGWHRFGRASRLLDSTVLSEIGSETGLVTDVQTGARRGWLVLWDIADLSSDYVHLGSEIGRATGLALDQEALLLATEEGAAARTRLSLARDVHDGVVQFLAAAAFRVEAIMRGADGEEQVKSGLSELKQLLIEEQGEIRALVSALRRDSELGFAEAVDELRALAARLSQQWSVDCRVRAGEQHGSIPIRVQLDLQLLLREAVANAVRHGVANRIEVDLNVEEGQLKMHVRDNGSGIQVPQGATLVQPWSLRERVERAGGSLMLASEPGRTEVVIGLPLASAAA